jgi:hypothetical protein
MFPVSLPFSRDSEAPFFNTGGPPPGAGTLFGVLFDPEVGHVFVDNGSNTLNVLQ